MTRTLVHILAISILALPAFGQEIEYEKYELPNGLTVILHEDHSLPVVLEGLELPEPTELTVNGDGL